MLLSLKGPGVVLHGSMYPRNLDEVGFVIGQFETSVDTDESGGDQPAVRSAGLFDRNRAHLVGAVGVIVRGDLDHRATRAEGDRGFHRAGVEKRIARAAGAGVVLHATTYPGIWGAVGFVIGQFETSDASPIMAHAQPAKRTKKRRADRKAADPAWSPIGPDTIPRRQGAPPRTQFTRAISSRSSGPLGTPAVFAPTARPLPSLLLLPGDPGQRCALSPGCAFARTPAPPSPSARAPEPPRHPRPRKIRP